MSAPILPSCRCRALGRRTAGVLFYHVVALATVLAAGHLFVPGADGMAGGSPTSTLSVAARIRCGGMGSLRGGAEPICVGLVALPRRMNVLLQSQSTGAQNERLPLEMLPLDPRGTIDAALPPANAFIAWAACQMRVLQHAATCTACPAASWRATDAVPGDQGKRASPSSWTPGSVILSRKPPAPLPPPTRITRLHSLTACLPCKRPT